MASATGMSAITGSVRLPDSERLYEVVDGEQREAPPMGVLAGMVATVLLQYLADFAKQHKLGLAVAEVLFRLTHDGQLQLRPDVAFVAYDRLPDPIFPPGEDPPAWDVVPNLAVEVVSPTNTAQEIEEKIHAYFEAGVQLVWVVYPRQRRIHVYESSTKAHILTEQNELNGSPVLPGFRLKIADLFAALVKPQ